MNTKENLGGDGRIYGTIMGERHKGGLREISKKKIDRES